MNDAGGAERCRGEQREKQGHTPRMHHQWMDDGDLETGTTYRDLRVHSTSSKHV